MTGDLYSLGVTLYEAVEGFSPLRRDTPTGTLKAVILGDAPPPKRAGRLTALITALMATDPGRRPNIEQSLSLLNQPPAQPSHLPSTAIRHVPPPAAPPVDHLRELSSSPGIRAALAASVVIGAALLGAFAFYLISGDDDKPSSVAQPPSPRLSPSASPARSVRPSPSKEKPPDFTVVDWNWDGPCKDGCAITAIFRNNGGLGDGTATVRVKTDKDGGDVLATCTVLIPKTAAGDSVRAGCKAYSSDLDRYFRDNPGKSVWGSVSVN